MASFPTDYKKCILCQIHDLNMLLTANPKHASFDNILKFLLGYKEIEDSNWMPAYNRLRDISAEDLQNWKAIYHVSCYKSLTNKTNLDRRKRKLTPASKDSDFSERKSRRSLPPYNRERCFFCQIDNSNTVHQITSENMDKQLKETVLVLNNDLLRIRLSSIISDATASDVKYHLPCWIQHGIRASEKVNKTEENDVDFNSLKPKLIEKIDECCTEKYFMTTADAFDIYENLLQQYSIEDTREVNTKKKWIRKIIVDELPDIEIQKPMKVRDPSQLIRKEMIRILVDDVRNSPNLQEQDQRKDEKADEILNAAADLRQEVKTFLKSNPFSFDGTFSVQKDQVPTKLFAFFKLLLAGDKDLASNRDKTIEKDVVTLCNQVLKSFKTDRQMTYKPQDDSTSIFRNRNENNQAACLGLALRQHGRRKGVINLLHGFNIVISNRQCLFYETAIANAVLANMALNGGFFLPSGIQKSVFIHFHIDNAVFAVDALDGKSTVDTLNIAGFQRNLKLVSELRPLEIDHSCRKQSVNKNNLNEKIFAKNPDLRLFRLPHGCASVPHSSHLLTLSQKDIYLSWILSKTVLNVLQYKECINANTLLQVESEDTMEDKEENIPISFLVEDAHTMYTKNDTTDISLCQSTLNLSIPPWSAYQSILSKNDNFRTSIFRFPLIQGPSIDYSSIYTALKHAQKISIWTDSTVKKTVVSLDLDLYFRALQLVQSRDDMKDKYILRLGELHAVFAHLRAIGTFVENSGIDDAWEQSGIFGTVVIRQILSCSNMKRAIAGHEITLIVLYRLFFEALLDENPFLFTGPCGSIFEQIQELHLKFTSRDAQKMSTAYEALLELIQASNFIDTMKKFEESKHSNKMFRILMVYIRMVERLLTFIYATRSRDWELHLLAGEMLTKDFCSMDRTKYRRLWPVYIQNMKALEYSDPELWEVFMNGEFCVKKTDIPFTSLGMDHAGEQVIKTLKVEGGGIKGITNNENARLRFFLSSPVLAKISDDIKKMINKDRGDTTKHHLDRQTEIRRRSEMESKLYEVLSERLDFIRQEKEENIFNIMTNAVVPEDYHKQMLECEILGENCNKMFHQERLQTDSVVSIWAPIKLLRLPKFRLLNKKVKVLHNEKWIELQEHAELFGRCAMIAASNREFDLKNVIGNHELSVVPRSLMLSDGSLIPGHEGKSNMMNDISVEFTESEITGETFVEIKTMIIDAMVIVQSLDKRSDELKTCSDISKAFIYKCKQLASGCRYIRIAFDTYRDSSLKEATRIRRKSHNSSVQFLVDDNTEIRGSLKKFLSNEGTKRNLVKYLSQRADYHLSRSEFMYSISAEGRTIGNIPSTLINNHEEADTLLVLLAIETCAIPLNSKADIHYVTVYSPDTDVFIILCSFHQKLSPMTFMRTRGRVIDIQKSVLKIGSTKAEALVGLHCFTGSDTTGKFRKKGKTSWLKRFETAPEKTVQAFVQLGKSMNVNDRVAEVLEEFVCQGYCRNFKGASLSDVRWHLFSKSAKNGTDLPPTHAAFVQHIMRANYQSSIWRQADNHIQLLDNPENQGWKLDSFGSYRAVGFTNLVAPKDILELVKCGCTTGCHGNRCRCSKNKLPCTDMCECQSCENREKECFVVGDDIDEEDVDC